MHRMAAAFCYNEEKGGDVEAMLFVGNPTKIFTIL